jgi:hypothetical protein
VNPRFVISNEDADEVELVFDLLPKLRVGGNAVSLSITAQQLEQ